MKLEIHDSRLWKTGIDVIDGPLQLDNKTMERICSRWNAFEKGSLMNDLANAAEDAADTITHLHNLLGYETEEGLDAIIGIQRILAEINYR